MESYLNHEHIARSRDGVEYHPLLPFLPPNARVLFLGSFPPQRKRWCMDFYYPNFINDHWRIEGAVFYGDRNHFVDEAAKTFRLADIVAFCREQGIAFFDTSTAIRRLQDNASDKFLEVVEPTDVGALIARLPRLLAVVTTGEKATATLCSSMHIATVPKVNSYVPIPDTFNEQGRQVVLYRLPSSSRAYPLAFDKKVEAYRRLFAFTRQADDDAPRLTHYDMGSGITAFSTTRHGGCSVGSYAAFNINGYCGDDEAHIRSNKESLCRLLGISSRQLVMPHQTHDTRVACIDKRLMAMTDGQRREALEGIDALMTNLPGVCIGVSTADCIPILLHDPRQHAVCAIHAGWRGTVGRIAEKAVAAMTTTYGTQPADIVAQIGPGISLDSFEVGQEVYDAFAEAGFDMAAISRQYPSSTDATARKWHIDLPACNRLQLLRAGLTPQHVADSQTCTYLHCDQYFSARRLGIRSGRIFTAILIRPATRLTGRG